MPDCTTLNYIEHLLILASAVTGFISIPVFAYLVNIPIGIASSAVGLKICANSIVSKNLNTIEVSIFSALIDS